MPENNEEYTTEAWMVSYTLGKTAKNFIHDLYPTREEAEDHAAKIKGIVWNLTVRRFVPTNTYHHTNPRGEQ